MAAENAIEPRAISLHLPLLTEQAVDWDLEINMNRWLSSLTVLAVMLVCLADIRCRADYPSVPSVPMLPDAVDSFGAAAHDGWIYV